jgi:4-carboxymuconolactone decarboxylase
MRLSSLRPQQMNACQRELHDEIASGPRASGPQHFTLLDDAGALTGPFAIMVQLPALGRPLQELGAAIRYRTGLTARVREIAILSVAAATASEFEQYAHERVGRAVGLSEEELTRLAQRRFSSVDPGEVVAWRFCERLNNGELPLADEEFAAFRKSLGQDALIELTVLVGYYRTLSQLLHVFEVGAPGKAVR